jgi:cytochrome c-type biogenesis protein CcmF
MVAIGGWSLYAAMILAVYSALASVWGVRSGRPGLTRSGENAVIGVFFFVTLAVAGIEYAIHTNDFSLHFVWANSSRELPDFYKWTSLWGGMQGSLLFWVWIMTLYAGIVVLQGNRGVEKLMPYAVSTLMVITLFFLYVTTFLENPYTKLPVPAPDGRGLNPLLQDPGMSFHPPTLYLGFIGMVVPYSFAMAALFTGRLDTEWITRTRKWALAAWVFLTLGNLLGGWWAYHVLGWGGYWGWDPVENSAFLPWLVTTAYLHSIQIEERRAMLRSWNMMLIIFAWTLTIAGTLATRSGIITSVHSFGEGPIGAYFMGCLAVTLIVSLTLVVYRAPFLRSREHMRTFVSREGAFLLNNLLLVCGAFAVVWGVWFPILSEAVTGEKITISAPFYLRIMIPVGIAILFLMGVGPFIAWRKATRHNFRRNFVVPVTVGVVAAGFLFSLGTHRWEALLAWSLGTFVLTGIVIEFYRGVKTRMTMAGENVAAAGFELVARSKRRFGGYVVHVGVVIVFAGFAGSAYNQHLEADLSVGETAHLAGYDFTFEGYHEERIDNYDSLKAQLLVHHDGEAMARLLPEFRFYTLPEEQRHTRVAIHSSFTRDVYVYLAGTQPGRVSVDIHVNPLVSWVWGGGIITVIGTLIAIWPDRRRARVALGSYGERIEPATERKVVGV